MITVSILINGNPIYTRTAVNITSKESFDSQVHRYKLDSGEEILHVRNDGAVQLAHKMLDTIEEVDADPPFPLKLSEG